MVSITGTSMRRLVDVTHKSLKMLKSYGIFLGMVIVSAAAMSQRSPASIRLVGDTADVLTSTNGGVVLIGGGGLAKGAFEWMAANSGGGDAVIVRSADTFSYTEEFFRAGKLNSIETLLIDSREKADDDRVAAVIRNAELLFLPGGDQSRYMRLWRDTKTEAAINYLLNDKKVPVGGTSAGCAVLTGFYYSGEKGSATMDALKNPYDTTVTLYNNDFLQPAALRNVLSDQHYVARKRQGRHVVFLARIIRDWSSFPKGIAPDERTAVIVDSKGQAKVFGEGKAYFIETFEGATPEVCEPRRPLDWRAGTRALRVYEVQGTPSGNGRFDVIRFRTRKAKGGTWYWWWVENGELKTRKIE